MKMHKSTCVIQNIEERIYQVEMNSQIKFPINYINFIKENNLGVPLTNKFLYNNHEYVIDRFTGFLNDFRTNPLGDFDIAVILSQIELRLTDNPDLVGDEQIPIAVLFCGDLICLDFRLNKINPQIAIWFHETSEEFNPNISVIFKTFDNFINNLL